MKQQKIKLLPCPFCGAEAHMWSWNYGTRIDCSRWNASKHLVGIGGATQEEAIEAWNKRAKQ